MSQLKESQSQLKLSFKDIQVATNNFETCIGKGGYGLVYKGQLSINGKLTTVAVKRLNENLSQGLKEFLTEIQLLSGQEHENLVSLIGFCHEGREKILVYEYAERGSLDRYIRGNSTTYTLTWLERLKICVSVAQGLDHLHNHVGEHQTIIHRDIKSANILLDANWVAKISDLGLSKLSLAGLDRSTVISHACGTPGYCEPEYIITGVVKKESDVYSFGMVLFEVLCGRLCMIEDDAGFMLSAQSAKDLYENGRLEEIIDPILRKQMNSYSMGTFSAIAYRCLHDDRIQRPPVDLIIKELVELIEFQEEYEEKGKSGNIVEFDSEEYWKNKLPRDIENFIKNLDSFPVYTTSKELFMILRNGISFDLGSRFFSINNDGVQCEMIYANKFLKWKPRFYSKEGERGIRSIADHSMSYRCSKVGEYPHLEELNIRCQIRTSMLSPGIMYAASLIFSFESWDHIDFVWIKWKCQELRVSSAHFAEEISEANHKTREYRKLKSTLWHFVNNEKNAYFEIELTRILGAEEPNIPCVTIHAIEFQPVKMKQHDQTHGLESISISAKDMDSEKITHSDYKDIIHTPETHLVYTTSKDLYVDPVGVLNDDGQMWFSTCKFTGGKCLMLSAAELIQMSAYSNPDRSLNKLSLSESRFKQVIALEVGTQYSFEAKKTLDMLLPAGRVYACYLVFKLVDGNTTTPEYHDTSFLQAICRMRFPESDRRTMAHLKLREPIKVPIIKPTKNNRVRDSSKIPKFKNSIMPKRCIKGYMHTWMEHRNDGWMDVFLCKSHNKDGRLLHELVTLKLDSVKGPTSGLIVEGIEFRPIETDV